MKSKRKQNKLKNKFITSLRDKYVKGRIWKFVKTI